MAKRQYLIILKIISTYKVFIYLNANEFLFEFFCINISHIRIFLLFNVNTDHIKGVLRYGLQIANYKTIAIQINKTHLF